MKWQLFWISVILGLSHCSTDNSTNSTYTYCPSSCIDYVEVCSNTSNYECVLCAQSIFQTSPVNGQCQTLSHHQIVANELASDSMSLAGYSATKTTPETCGHYRLSGANVANDYISKTFTNLPSNHYEVVIRFNMGTVGNWDGTEQIYVDVDGTRYAHESSCGWSMDICSGYQTDCIKFKENILPHTHANLTINISTSITEVNPAIKYWGIKDLLVVARLCHDQCLTCFGGLNSQCLTCAEGFFLKGNKCVASCPEQRIPSTRKCVPTCPQGFYTDEKECKECIDGCSVCFSEGTCNIWNDGRVGNSLWDQYLLLWILIILAGAVLLIMLAKKCLSSEKTEAEESMIPQQQSEEMVESSESIEQVRVAGKKRKIRKRMTVRLEDMHATNEDIN